MKGVMRHKEAENYLAFSRVYKFYILDCDLFCLMEHQAYKERRG